MSGNVEEDTNNDTNNDDFPESTICDVIIRLLDGNFEVVATTLTNSNGEYVLYDLPDGRYIVIETDSPGYVSVSDVSRENDNRIPDIDLGSGENVTGKDFVDEQLKTINGWIKDDVENDGLPDEDLEGSLLLSLIVIGRQVGR